MLQRGSSVAALLRDIDKFAATFVQVHLIRTEIRKVEIGQTVVVDVADGCAHPVAGGVDAALLE